MKLLIAIDPGKKGAIAYETFCPEKVSVFKMPETVKDLADELKAFAVHDGIFAWLEDVGSPRPWDGKKQIASLQRHVGNLEGILASLQIPYDFVKPTTWEHWLVGKPNHKKIPPGTIDKARKQILQKRKKDRKNLIKAKVQRLYPHEKVTLDTADALGIMSWARGNR